MHLKRIHSSGGHPTCDAKRSPLKEATIWKPPLIYHNFSGNRRGQGKNHLCLSHINCIEYFTYRRFVMYFLHESGAVEVVNLWPEGYSLPGLNLLILK